MASSDSEKTISDDNAEQEGSNHNRFPRRRRSVSSQLRSTESSKETTSDENSEQEEPEYEEVRTKVKVLRSENHLLCEELRRQSEECEKLASENDSLMEELNQIGGSEAISTAKTITTTNQSDSGSAKYHHQKKKEKKKVLLNEEISSSLRAISKSAPR